MVDQQWRNKTNLKQYGTFSVLSEHLFHLFDWELLQSKNLVYYRRGGDSYICVRGPPLHMQDQYWHFCRLSIHKISFLNFVRW